MRTGGKQWKGKEHGQEGYGWTVQVDVGRLKQDEKARGWQPESSMRGSRWCRAPIAALQN
jgi:hypothetical protein